MSLHLLDGIINGAGGCALFPGKCFLIYADVTFNRETRFNNELIYCKIYNTGAGGVSLGGGGVKTLNAAHNYVDSCEIFNSGLRYQTYAPGIDFTGVGNRISNCKIYNSPNSGIIYHGNEHLIENNEIFHVLLESDDGVHNKRLKQVGAFHGIWNERFPELQKNTKRAPGRKRKILGNRVYQQCIYWKRKFLHDNQ